LDAFLAVVFNLKPEQLGRGEHCFNAKQGNRAISGRTPPDAAVSVAVTTTQWLSRALHGSALRLSLFLYVFCFVF